MTSPPTIRVLGRLGPDDAGKVQRMVTAATEVDGTTPLDEHVLLHLRHGGDERTRNVLAVEEGEIVGYAHLDVTDEVAGASGQLVVDPERRGHGVGRRLVEELTRLSPDGRLRLWAHGERSDVIRMIAPLGFVRSRSLLQMRRSLLSPLPDAVPPPDVTIRTFEPGRDDTAWVAVNAAAFADHPEQGRWTLADLRRRMAEPWFDPAGFFLAERRNEPDSPARLVGFHWTKVHGGDGRGNGLGTGHGHEPIGEVYVVGVHPDERGSGLGRTLTIVGLRHLRARGLTQAMLYVDGDNVSAVRLYESLGFTRWDVDVVYARR